MRTRRHLPVLAALMFAGCSIGPHYERPALTVPAHFKEAAEGWKVAQPGDEHDRGAWWEVFGDAELNALEEKVATSNQTVAGFEAAYRQARALIAETRASYFPTLGVSASGSRAHGTLAGAGRTTPAGENYNLSLDASWEPDLWGRVRHQVRGAKASAQGAAAELANAKLSAQGTLAQSYFQLRALDAAQKLLDDTVAVYQKALELTQNRYAQGVASRGDVLQAQTQLLSAQAAALDNHIARAQFEHAIAVLIGVPASAFSIPTRPLDATPPEIPARIPSALLERRPDIAAAERRAAAANEQIGVAMSAFFPSLTLSAVAGLGSSSLGSLLTAPALVWSLGPQLAEVLFNGGLRLAQTEAARAAYDQSAAAYRQTVLAAFQDVEDNLVALSTLEKEFALQQQAVRTAHQSLEVITNEYKAGTATYLDVIASQTIAFSAENRLINVSSRRMVSAVGLIKALGGGWNVKQLDEAAK